MNITREIYKKLIKKNHKEFDEFLKERNIRNLTIINFIKRIDYAIRYADIKKIEE